MAVTRGKRLEREGKGEGHMIEAEEGEEGRLIEEGEGEGDTIEEEEEGGGVLDPVEEVVVRGGLEADISPIMILTTVVWTSNIQVNTTSNKEVLMMDTRSEGSEEVGEGEGWPGLCRIQRTFRAVSRNEWRKMEQWWSKTGVFSLLGRTAAAVRNTRQ